jgi:dihydropteroate synthase
MEIFSLCHFSNSTPFGFTASNVAISIDTRNADVARAAINAGADIVNDVSGGRYDTQMLPAIGELEVPMILMHMRGTPETMQTLTTYDNVVHDVAATILKQSNIAAEKHSIHRWQQIVDPGIGFAKDLRGNLLLLKHIAVIRSVVRSLPILIGTSRKGFIGTITNVSKADERDAGTIASCVTALCLEETNASSQTSKPCNILRVHNVAQCRQATLVMDAIRNVL